MFDDRFSNPNRRKIDVNLSVRADLVEEAESFGTNISAVLEHAFDEENCLRRMERWRTENRKAILAWNDWIEENGIPFSELRPWWRSNSLTYVG